MNITTLLELIQTTTDEKQFNGRLRSPSYSQPRGKHLGNGFYSSVSNHNKDPHLVKKHSRSPAKAKEDQFTPWATYMVSHNLMENPHFPRVYNIKKITDKNGKFIYTYDMERLNPLYNISKEMLLSILETNFNDFVMHSDARHEVDNIQVTCDFIAETISHAVKENDHTHIKLDSLKNAIDAMHTYIIDIKKAYDSGDETVTKIPFVDIHGNNIMLRNTKYGFTLVITDPFA